MEEIRCYTCLHNLNNINPDHAYYCEELRVVFHADEKMREKEMRKYQRLCDGYELFEKSAAESSV
jgi:hypothetical protein